MLEFLAFPAVIIVMLTSTFLLIVHDWRIQIGLLATQYLGVFFLIGLNWPMAMSAALLIAGWTAGTILSMALISFSHEKITKESRITGSRIQFSIHLSPQNIFYFISSIFVVIIAFTLAPNLSPMLPEVNDEILWSSIILMGMGLLQIGLNTKTLPLVLGLFTIISGFEIIYSAVEQSTLIAGLLSVVTLALSLTGAYLVLSPSMELEE